MSVLFDVTAVLARSPAAPDGDIRHGLTMTLPLDRSGLPDRAAQPPAERWRGIRFAGAESETFRFFHEEEGWSVACGEGAHCRRLRFEEPVRPGALLWLEEAGGEAAYRVVLVARAGD